MGKFDFEKDMHRENRNTYKWSYDVEPDEVKNGLYPMSVADMEYDTPECIKEKLIERVEAGVFGYETVTEKYFETVRDWIEKKHNLKLQCEDILESTNAIISLSIILQGFTEKSDEIIVHSPGYNNFFYTTEILERKVLESPLKIVNDKYEIDFENMEKIVTEKTKAIIFCNPQNPTGNVWTEEDITKLCEFSKKHNLLIISDELHFEFIFNGKKHIMTESISQKVGSKCITLISPGKSFNVSGCKTSSVIVTDKKLKEIFETTKNKFRFPPAHSFAESITIGAYSEKGEEWLEEVKKYIDENRKIFINFINEKLPKIKIYQTDATFLLWLDFSKLNLSDEELERLIRKECKLKFNQGTDFGKNYSQFRRINIAVQRFRLNDAIERLQRVFEGL